MSKEWQPLIEEKDSKVYREKLSEIAEILLEHTGKSGNNIGVMGGKAGVALFAFYYANMIMDEKFVDFGHQLISEMFDTINNEQSIHTFAGGLAGVGWMMEHLVQKDFVEADTDEILEALDPFLHKAMIYDIEKGNYDFLHGAVGLGTYFLSRVNKKDAPDHLIELVDHLDKQAHRKEDGGIAWESLLDRDKGTKGYNLSLSHGLASIIGFLARMLERGIYKEKVSELLNGAVTFMLNHRVDPEKFKCYFPSWIGEDYEPAGSRLAWCYGDLGIGMALLHAAKVTGNQEWEKVAVDALELTATRLDPKENAVVDAGLCHGGAGLAHIYNRAYQDTGLEIFKETAKHWLDVTLQLASHEDGFAGYKAWHTEKYGGWVAEVGLLEGISGIGLMLIAILNNIDPGWDHCLYLS